MSNDNPRKPRRDARGRITGGVLNPKGNTALRRSTRWRREFDSALTVDDFLAVVAKVIEAAKQGQKWACEAVLNHSMGRPVETSFVEAMDEAAQQLEALEKEVGR